MKVKQVRAQYTQEFKLEAVRQVSAGQAIAVVAKVLRIPKASLGNWVRRLHSSLGYLSPMQFEQRWYEAQCKKAALSSG